MRELLLGSGWQVKAVQASEGGASAAGSVAAAPPAAARDEQGWVQAAVPGLAHEALWAAGRLPDPYLARSHTPQDPRLERSFLWDFLYRCRFDAPEGLLGGAAALCCDGLDTIATVWLNGVQVLRSDNMFVPQRAKVGSLLRPRDNQLLILFESALRTGRERQARGGERPVWNGDPSRLYVRKAQVQYGWDFGPTLLSAGPWRPVRICARPLRLADVKVLPEVAEDLRSARIPITARIERETETELAGGAELRLILRAPGGEILSSKELSLSTRGLSVEEELHLADPALWWPLGHGAQPLYSLELTLLAAGEVLDARTLRLGLRRLRLVEEPLPGDLGGGTSFYFEVNRRPIFCGGANWIPADLITTRPSAARLSALLDEAAAANMSMLRVWGGGIYEDDAFYDRCDELGILIFQDFLFACGMYPAHDGFAESVAAEAAAAARRLRHHACLALWAGNNEDYSIAQSVSAYAGPEAPIPTPAGPGERARFDGRRLYEQTLPAALRPVDPSRTYWPGSPYSRRSADPSDVREGDVHIWQVWHQAMLDYQLYGSLRGRFVSEFGMQAVPSRRTLRRALGDEPPSIEALALLNKGEAGPARIGSYLERNLPPLGRDLDRYIYATQLNQAESTAYAVRAFRRGFGPPGRIACAGALVWQLDDLWPGVSWALLEHYSAEDHLGGLPVRRKAAWYALRRELLPLSLGLAPSAEGAAAWAVQSAGSEVSGELRLRAFTPDGALRLDRSYAVRALPNQATELCELPLPDGALEAGRGDPGHELLIVGAELRAGGELLARAVLWPQPLKALPIVDPGLAITVRGDTVRVRAAAPAKGVLLALAGEDGETGPPRGQDHLLDLLPGDELEIAAPGLGGRAVEARSLFDLRGGGPR
jgi:beta-mannosidase